MAATSSQKINVALGEYEIDIDEEEIILGREVNVDGRNTCRVNGRIVPLRLVKYTGPTPSGHPWPKSALIPSPRT